MQTTPVFYFLFQMVLWVRNGIFCAMEKWGKYMPDVNYSRGSVWNQVGLPLCLLVVLVMVLFVANDCSCTLPHFLP